MIAPAVHLSLEGIQALGKGLRCRIPGGRGALRAHIPQDALNVINDGLLLGTTVGALSTGLRSRLFLRAGGTIPPASFRRI